MNDIAVAKAPAIGLLIARMLHGIGRSILSDQRMMHVRIWSRILVAMQHFRDFRRSGDHRSMPKTAAGRGAVRAGTATDVT